MNLYKQIFEKLYSAFGRQRWWPVTVKGHSPSYCGGPRSEKHRLEIIFGAILTQNTAWKNAEKAISQLNKNKLIDVDKIIRIKQSRFAKLIRSAGYYNQKSERLKIISEHIKNRYGGSIKKLFSKPAEPLRQELL